MLGNLLTILVKLLKFIFIEFIELVIFILDPLITISVVNCNNYLEYFTLLG